MKARLFVVLCLHACLLSFALADFVQLPSSGYECFSDMMTGVTICCDDGGNCFWDCYYDPTLGAMVCSDCSYDASDHTVSCPDGSCIDLDTGLPCYPNDSGGGPGEDPGGGSGGGDSGGGSGGGDSGSGGGSDCVCSYLSQIYSVASSVASLLQSIRNDLASYHSQSLSVFESRINTLQNRIESALQSIASILSSQTNPKLDQIRDELSVIREVLSGVRDLIFDIRDYLHDDSVFQYIDDVVNATYDYYSSVGDLIRQYAPYLYSEFYSSLYTIYYTLSSQSQIVNNESALILVEHVGYTPNFMYVYTPAGSRLYESGFLSSVVSYFNSAAQTHLLPIASLPFMTIYLNLDHPTVYWIRFLMRFLISLYLLWFFMMGRIREYTSVFGGYGGDS